MRSKIVERMLANRTPEQRLKYRLTNENYVNNIMNSSKGVFDKQGNELSPFKATHPGQILLKELNERGIKPGKFAFFIKMSPHHLYELLYNKGRNITPRTALKLEKALGVDAEFWLNLQSSYDIWQVKNKHISTVTK